MMVPKDSPALTPIYRRSDLLAHGESNASIARMIRTGVLRRPRHGIYVDGPTWDGMTEEQQYAVRSRAARLQARTDVVLSHTSALFFHQGPLWGLDLDDVHLTRRDHRTGRREAGVRQHSGRLLPEDVVEVSGLEVTSPARTVLEISTIASLEAALVVTNDLLHRALVKPDQLRDRYERERMERWPYSLHTDLLLRLADPRIESVGESRTFFFLWDQGLPLPEPQYEIVGPDGRLIARLDFAYPELGIWIEFDGKIKYEKHLRDGETVVDAVLREKQRESLVAELTGWRCLRVTWADLANPAQLAARIRALVAAGHRTRSAAV